MPPRWEIAVAMFDSDNPNGAKQYDIVLARPYTGVYGIQERKKFIWIPVDDLTDDLVKAITEPVIDGKTGGIKVKNRYKFDKSVIEKLDSKVVFSDQDAKDLSRDYQPFEKREGYNLTNSLTDKESR